MLFCPKQGYPSVHWQPDAGLRAIPCPKSVNERGAVTEDLAIRLSRVLGSTPQFWLAMQAKLTLWELEQKNARIYSSMERVQTV